MLSLSSVDVQELKLSYHNGHIYIQIIINRVSEVSRVSLKDPSSTSEHLPNAGGK